MGRFPQCYDEDERHFYPNPAMRGESRTGAELVRDLHASLDRITPPNRCQLSISPLCTREDRYQWRGRYCCGHCYSIVDRLDELTRADPSKDSA